MKTILAELTKRLNKVEADLAEERKATTSSQFLRIPYLLAKQKELNFAIDLVEKETAKAERDLDGLAHELWATAQLLPGEGIVDSVDRIKEILTEKRA